MVEHDDVHNLPDQQHARKLLSFLAYHFAFVRVPYLQHGDIYLSYVT